MTPEDSTERNEIGLAVFEICEKLPLGWTVTLEMTYGCANVCLSDEDGEAHEFPCNYEKISEELRDALEYALQDKRG